ncbi:MAG: hypothetical protein K2Y32_20405 [Candidatus Obscuribacterales bacterium]|nr:hypothetical protein [Candidatus Obscuribacterales bacterium]
MKNLPETKKLIAILRAVGILLLIMLSIAQAGGKPNLLALGIMLFLVPLGFVNLSPALMFALDLGGALLSSYLAPGEDACLYSCIFSLVYLAFANPMMGILSIMLAQVAALALKMQQLNSNLSSSGLPAQLFQTLWHTDWFNFAGTLIALYVVAYSIHADRRREAADKSLTALQDLQLQLEERERQRERESKSKSKSESETETETETDNRGRSELNEGKSELAAMLASVSKNLIVAPSVIVILLLAVVSCLQVAANNLANQFRYKGEFITEANMHNVPLILAVILLFLLGRTKGNLAFLALTFAAAFFLTVAATYSFLNGFQTIYFLALCRLATLKQGTAVRIAQALILLGFILSTQINPAGVFPYATTGSGQLEQIFLLQSFSYVQVTGVLLSLLLLALVGQTGQRAGETASKQIKSLKSARSFLTKT